MRTRPSWRLLILGAFLAFNLIQAILYGGRWAWISVAILALVLAWVVWQERQRARPPK